MHVHSIEIKLSDAGGFMNGHQIIGRWTQYKGKAQRAWGRITDDSANVVAAECKILIGEIREHYGLALKSTPAKGMTARYSPVNDQQ